MIKKVLTLLTLIVCICILTTSVDANTLSIVFAKGNTEAKRIALTFDDGPHPRYTPQILRILKKHNIRATFFVIGKNVESYPSVLKSIYENGHEIGNHSYDHNNVSLLSKGDVEQEIDKCEELIREQIGIRSKLFRPPQGKLSHTVEEVCESRGYSVILWSIDTQDWNHNRVDNIVSAIKGNAKSGDIILMHDYISGKNTTCDSLEAVIPELKKRGYEFVTVSELIGKK